MTSLKEKIPLNWPMVMTHLPKYHRKRVYDYQISPSLLPNPPKCLHKTAHQKHRISPKIQDSKTYSPAAKNPQRMGLPRDKMQMPQMRKIELLHLHFIRLLLLSTFETS